MDEEVIEIVAEVFRQADHRSPFAESYAKATLEALRAEGFDIYRPGDCELGVLDGATFGDNPPGKIGLIFVVDERPVTRDPNPYRLVPAERGE